MIRSLQIIMLVFVLFDAGVYANRTDNPETVTPEQAKTAEQMQTNLQKAENHQKTYPDSALYYYEEIIPDGFDDTDSYLQWVEDSPEVHKYYVAVALAKSGLINVNKGNLSSALNSLEKGYEISKIIKNKNLAVFCTDNLAVAYAEKNNFEKAVTYFGKSLEFYQKQKDVQGIMYCKRNIGAINANMGSFYEAAFYYEKLLDIQKEAPSVTVSVKEIIDIAMLYTKLEENQNATEFFEMALDKSIQENNKQFLWLIYSKMGECFFNLEKYGKSLEHYTKALNHSQVEKDNNKKVRTLNNIAILYYQLEDMQSSAKYWKKSLKLAKETGDGQIVFDALINLSEIYNKLGEEEKSIEYYESYLAFAQKVDDPVFNARSLFGMGEIHNQAGNYKQAREYFIAAHEAFMELDDYNKAAQINNLIAKTYQQQYNTNEALQYLNANIESIRISDSLVLAESYTYKADVYRILRQFDVASEYYHIALDIYTQYNHYDKASSIINALAYLQEVKGDYPRAVELYEKALLLIDISGNREAKAAIYNNLGVVYRHLGDISRARDSYYEAVEIYKKLDNIDALSYCYNNLGIIYEIKGNYDYASSYYEKSYNIKLDTDDKQGLAISLINLGNINRLEGSFQKSLENFQKSLELSKHINDNQTIADVKVNLSALYLELGEFDKALEYVNLSRYLAEKGGYQNTFREAQRQLAWTYHVTDVPKWAEESYMKVLNINYDEIERNFSILSESEKEMFLETVADDFDRFHSFALDRMNSNPEITKAVYNNLLKNKGLLLKSSTSMRNAILESGDNELINTYEQWIQIKQEIARLYSMPTHLREASLEELEQQANSLERSLVRNSAEFDKFEQSQNIRWSDIKKNLNANEAAIEFANFNHNDSILYCALIVKPGYKHPEMISLFTEYELRSVMGSYTDSDFNYISNLYGLRNQPQKKLYELVWEPLEKYLDETSRVYVSPSGLLHKISFAAISKDENYFISDDYDILNLSTTAHIASERDVILIDNINLALFGGIKYTIESQDRVWSYLPGTLDEINKIEEITTNVLSSVNIFSGVNGTKEQFIKIAPQSQILHVATHGYFFPDPYYKSGDEETEPILDVDSIVFRGVEPPTGITNIAKSNNPLMRSGIVFAGVNDYWDGAITSDAYNGVLTALDVINIDLRQTELVIMSACETGLGEIRGSEGVYGLQRAFKMAGADYLIMSLWQVPDAETAEFMTLLYEFIVREKELREAFTKTQNIMRKKYDPYFWAAFVLIE